MVGAGKSRTSKKYSLGGSDGSNIEGGISKSEYDELDSRMIEEMTSQNDSDYNSEIIEELKSLGVKVDLRGGDESLAQLLKDKGININQEDLVRVASKYGNNLVSKLDEYYENPNSNSFSSSERKVLRAIIDAELGIRTVNKMISYVNNIGISHTSWANTNKSEGSYSATNASLSTILKLSRVAKTLNITSLNTVQYLTTKEVSKGTVLGLYVPGDNKIQIDSKGLLSFQRASYTTTNHNIGSVYPQSIMAHEFGHHIENIVFKDYAKVKGSSAVSNYGNSNSHEAFAEAFSAYCLDIKPKKGKEYYSNFESLMESKGLSSFKGCLK